MKWEIFKSLNKQKKSQITNKSKSNKNISEIKSYIDIAPKNIKLNMIKPKEKHKTKNRQRHKEKGQKRTDRPAH